MTSRKFRMIKPEIRVLGVDDGRFSRYAKGLVPVVGVVFRGGYWLDGVMHTRVEVDGFDATRKIASMILNSPHYKQLRVIMLDGITFAGFNIVDVRRLNIDTELPVISVTREKPDLAEIRKALENLPQSKERWKTIINAGRTYRVFTRSENEEIYFQTTGISRADAAKILQLTSTRSNIPEALRVAHLIASGVSAT